MTNPKPYRLDQGKSLDSSFVLNDGLDIFIKNHGLPEVSTIVKDRVEVIIGDMIFLNNQFIHENKEIRQPNLGEIRANLNEIKKKSKPFYKRLTLKQRASRAEEIYLLLIRLDKITKSYLMRSFGSPRLYLNSLKSLKYNYSALDYCANKKTHSQHISNKKQKILLQDLELFIKKLHSACDYAILQTPRKKGGRPGEKVNSVAQVVNLLRDAFVQFNLTISKKPDDLFCVIVRYICSELELGEDLDITIDRAIKRVF